MRRGNLRINLIEEAAEEAGVYVEEAKDSFVGYEAHHIIPVEVLTQIFDMQESELGEEFNGTWNGIFLKKCGEDNSHAGSHPNYSELIRELLQKEIDNGQSVMDAIKNLAAVIKNTLIESKNNDLGGSINEFEEYITIIEKIAK